MVIERKNTRSIIKKTLPIVSSPWNRCGVRANVTAIPPVLIVIVYQLKVTSRTCSHRIPTRLHVESIAEDLGLVMESLMESSLPSFVDFDFGHMFHHENVSIERIGRNQEREREE